jgi:hypothetical protein
MEDQVPETHLLRLIEKHISFEFVRERLRSSYSESGRPSIDPELLLRILLIGYLYGITSERKLVEELRMHLSFSHQFICFVSLSVPPFSGAGLGLGMGLFSVPPGVGCLGCSGMFLPSP